jgi:hypothetical protein
MHVCLFAKFRCVSNKRISKVYINYDYIFLQEESKEAYKYVSEYNVSPWNEK